MSSDRVIVDTIKMAQDLLRQNLPRKPNPMGKPFRCYAAVHSRWRLVPKVFWTALSERRGGLQLGGAAKPETTYLAMNLFFLLAVAVPLSCCLGFLSLLAFLGVMILGAIIHVVGIARAGRPQWRRVEPANNSAG
jgi:hypothetical protein